MLLILCVARLLLGCRQLNPTLAAFDLQNVNFTIDETPLTSKNVTNNFFYSKKSLCCPKKINGLLCAKKTFVPKKSIPARAMSHVKMGELSAAKEALEGAPVVPDNMATLRALTDPEMRPPLPREKLSRAVAEAQPTEQFELDTVEFLICLRRARRGAAGSSGMTSDHLFPVVESETAIELLTQVANLFAVGQVFHDILEAIKLGRLTALQKTDGGVRGIVVGEIFPQRNKSPRELKLPRLPSSA